MNPYLIIAAGVGTIALAVGAFLFGERYESGQHAKAEALIADVREQAQLGAADAIAKQHPVQQIIKQKLETTTRENTVYRDCHNYADAFGLLNSLLTNHGPDAAGGLELPAADTSH